MFYDRNKYIEAQDIHFSYLPYTHVFEQAFVAATIMAGIRVGYSNGDPKQLIDECQALKPNHFPSVPRFYNKVFMKINSSLDEKTSVSKIAKFLINNAFDAK